MVPRTLVNGKSLLFIAKWRLEEARGSELNEAGAPPDLLLLWGDPAFVTAA